MEKSHDGNGRIKIKLSLREWIYVFGAIAAIGSYGATTSMAIAQNKKEIIEVKTTYVEDKKEDIKFKQEIIERLSTIEGALGVKKESFNRLH